MRTGAPSENTMHMFSVSTLQKSHTLLGVYFVAHCISFIHRSLGKTKYRLNSEIKAGYKDS